MQDLNSLVGVLLILTAAGAAAGRVSGAVPAEPRNEPRTDFHGDLLPEGAIARLGTVRYRVGGRGYRVGTGEGRIEFAADGRTLLECSGGHLLWLDVTTGHIVRTLDLGSDRPALLLAVTRDRATAAVRTHRFPKQGIVEGAEYQIVLIDTSTGEVRSRLPVWKVKSFMQPTPGTCAAFTPDGSRLALGDDAGGLRVWNVVTGREEQAARMPSAGTVPRGTQLPPPETVESVAFSGDGTWLVAASRQEAVRWKWQQDAPPQPIKPFERIGAVEFAPDGKVVAMTGRRTTRLFDVATGRQVRQLAAGGVVSAPSQFSFTSDGSRLVIPTASQRGVELWNLRDGDVERTLPFESTGFKRSPTKAIVSPDDRWLVATALADAPTGVWDLETGERLGDGQVGHIQSINTLLVSPDGTQVLTAGYDGLALLWQVDSGRPVHVFHPAEGSVLYQGLAFSPDGKWIANSVRDEVVIRDRQSGEPAFRLAGHGGYLGPRSLRFTPDSERLLSFGEDWSLRVYDVLTGELLLEHSLPAATEAKFTSDGRTLVLVSRQQYRDKVHLFDVETGRERTHYETEQSVSSLAVSPDGERLATVQVETAGQPSSQFPVLQYQRLEDGAVAFSFRLDREGPVAFSPDGSKIATASPAIEVYDLATARRIARIEAPPRDVSALAFTPDGEGLVAAHADATAVIWDWRHFPVSRKERR